tara:strand:+ start:238 stop:1041 length:804 start_codon:yes stop_codon:yes gene_type:complete
MIQTNLYSFSYKKGSLLPWCKSCGKQNFYKAGKSARGFQRYKCRACGSRFIWSSDLPGRTLFSNVIAFAVELYGTVGISLRAIRDKLKKFFDIKISHEGVRQWILAAQDLKVIDDNRIPTKTWHIDETYIKIRGIGYWLWVVYCKESKHVIAYHISKSHLYKDAYATLQKAMQVTKGVRPELIITDGLYQYPPAIKKVIGWNWREQKKRHLVDSGIGKNALIERVNKEIKRRVRWFGSFQALDCAYSFFNLFFYHLNSKGANSRELT